MTRVKGLVGERALTAPKVELQVGAPNMYSVKSQAQQIRSSVPTYSILT